MSKISNPFLEKQLAELRKRKKPAFTVKDFTEGTKKFGESSALDFIEYCNALFKKKKLPYEKIEELFGVQIDRESVYEALQGDKSVVIIKNGDVAENLSFKEFISVIEHGRKDKGIMPDPVVRFAFDSYKDRYKENLKKFLLGKP